MISQMQSENNESQVNNRSLAHYKVPQNSLRHSILLQFSKGAAHTLSISNQAIWQGAYLRDHMGWWDCGWLASKLSFGIEWNLGLTLKHKSLKAGFVPPPWGLLLPVKKLGREKNNFLLSPEPYTLTPLGQMVNQGADACNLKQNQQPESTSLPCAFWLCLDSQVWLGKVSNLLGLSLVWWIMYLPY